MGNVALPHTGPASFPPFRGHRICERLVRVLGAVPPLFLQVSVRAQQLSVVKQGRVLRRFAISTARAGRGCRSGSLRTPTGVHVITRRIGAGAPIGTVFRGRIATGARWRGAPTHADLILTRILRLRGLQAGHNRGGTVDTYRRYIYIHGTNHEKKIATPASHGCIRMRNKDIVELFEMVQRGSIVIIT